MDTSNNISNIKVYDLRDSPHPEDQETAKVCEQIVKQILTNLKPILRYICVPTDFDQLCGVRCLEIGSFVDWLFPEHEKPILFLSESGGFFYAQRDQDTDKLPLIACWSNRKPNDVVYNGDDAWGHMPFRDLVVNLKAALDKAEQKRREHLRAINDWFYYRI